VGREIFIDADRSMAIPCGKHCDKQVYHIADGCENPRRKKKFLKENFALPFGNKPVPFN
jgi:hypothetical protein